jgi:hypothetical protein
MHDIEPFYNWRELYNPDEDAKSPFFELEHDAFRYTNRVYNYYIHPLWDNIGSETLYIKVLYADYEEGIGIIELIGEWNDCINNDIMFLKRDIIDLMIREGIYKFILLCEHVFNFHGSDDCYYEEWKEDIEEHNGYIVLLNLQEHVLNEMKSYGLQYHTHFGNVFQDLNWRKMNPTNLAEFIESKI